MAKTMMKM